MSHTRDVQKSNPHPPQKSVFGRSRSSGRTRPRIVRLSVDMLEDRITPSTFLVTNTLDSARGSIPGSLRWAVNQANLPANQGSTVAISPAVQGSSGSPATITLRGGELSIRSSLTIENASGGPVTIQGNGSSRIFDVANGPRTISVTLTGQSASTPLTLTGGNVRNGNGGAILVQSPQTILTLAYVNVTGNSASQVNNARFGAAGNGGGIYSRGTVSLDHSSVSFNTASGLNAASGHAGGVYADQGVTLVASHVDSNTARNSAGILNVFGSVEVVQGSTVSNNSSNGNVLKLGDLGGGGISQMSGNVFVSDSQVNNNQTLGMYSGGIVILLGGVTVTDGSQVNGNTNNGPGGGIAANFEGPVTVSHGSQIDGNTGAGLGGGIVNFSENFGINIVDHSQVANNTLTNMEVSGATSGLIQVALNPPIRTAFLSGGRGDAMLKSSLQLFLNACAQRATLITQATAALPTQGNSLVGGGIAEILGGPIVINGSSVISGNHFRTVPDQSPAPGMGGGVFSNISTVTIDGSTISNNVATGNGGGIWNGGSLTITNSFVTQNQTAGQGGGIFNRGTFTSTNTSVTNNTPNNIYP